MDEFLHTLGAIDGIGDELVGFGIEFLAVALSEELDVAGDEPEGLLEVVRGDVGKLLEVAVGAFELGEGGVGRSSESRRAVMSMATPTW